MFASSRSTLLIVDDNPPDIELFTLAWAEADYDAGIQIESCVSLPCALAWERDLSRNARRPVGILVDYYLFDEHGTPAIEILARRESLKGVAKMSWSGSWKESDSTRITRSQVLALKKPGDWYLYREFVARVYDHLLRCASSGSGRQSIGGDKRDYPR